MQEAFLYARKAADRSPALLYILRDFPVWLCYNQGQKTRAAVAPAGHGQIAGKAARMNTMQRIKPPMGWNTWNTFGPNIDEKLIMESADAMVESGLRDAGYEYIVIDDMWSLKERDKDGFLVPDPEKFPHGMKYIADYVHARGLKFGMYSCGGYLTCGGYPGSYGHEWQDAQTFAQWGVDYLKYDYCFHPANVSAAAIYRRMGVALANCGRKIHFNACSWGSDHTRQWIRETGAHSWRSTGDISDCWASIKSIAQSQIVAQEYNAPGCFNDMDMLVVGMNGEGTVGITGCNDDEYRLHFALWAFLQSPLMIGCDIRHMSDATKKILMNRDIIAINQDDACTQAYIAPNLLQAFGAEERGHEVNLNRAPDEPFYTYSDYSLSRCTLVRMLANGDFAVMQVNFRDHETFDAPLVVTADMLGIPEDKALTMQVTDLWTGENVPLVNGTIPNRGIPAHGARIYRVHLQA